MDKIIAFLMTHPDVTVEIEKDINFYQAVNITMRKNNAKYREVVRIERITELESILVYMYDVVSSKEKNAVEKGELIDKTMSDHTPIRIDGVTEKCPKCGEKVMYAVGTGTIFHGASESYEDWRVIKHDYCPRCGTKIEREGAE